MLYFLEIQDQFSAKSTVIVVSYYWFIIHSLTMTNHFAITQLSANPTRHTM